MFCKRCGSRLPEGTIVCPKCGTPVSHAAKAPRDAPVPSPDAKRAAQEPRRNPEPLGGTSRAEPAPREETPAKDEPAHDQNEQSSPSTLTEPDRPAADQKTPVTPLVGDRRRLVIIAAMICVVLIGVIGVGIVSALQGGASDTAESTTQESPVEPASNADGASSDGSDEPVSAPEGNEEEVPAVRALVDAYSWDELSQVSALIAQADSDAEGLEIAEEYHLCNADGTLDGSQVKSFTLKDGTQTSAQIVGFRQDERSDGAGPAGITFICTDALALHEYDLADTNDGGWRASDLRTWCNSELLARFPADLQHALVAADKLTNNVGATSDTSSVTVTSDKLWLPSYNELIGDVDPSLAQNLPVYNAEGGKYQLYVDTDVLWSAENPILVKHLAVSGEAVSWWQRSPYPDSSDYVMDTGADGIPYYAHVPSKQYGVVPGFCI